MYSHYKRGKNVTMEDGEIFIALRFEHQLLEKT